MAIIKSMVRVGQKPDAKEMRRIKNELREAKKYTVNLDDCPELPPDILKEFAFLAAAVRNESANRQKPRSGLPLSSVPAAH